MFCWNCGAKNADSSKFCTGCGAKLVNEAAAAPVQSASVQPAPVPVPAAPAAEPKAKAPAAQKPVRRKKTGWIIGGVAAIVIAAIAAAVIFLVPMLRYNAAEALLNDKKYEDAAEAFEALGDYKDAEERMRKAMCLHAEALLEDGEFKNAAEIFESLGDYKDAEEQAQEALYLYAKELLEDGKIEEAEEILGDLDGYGDSGQADAGGVQPPDVGPVEGDTPAGTNAGDAVDLSGTYDITMWVPEMSGVEDVFLEQIEAFEAAYPGIVINASIDGVYESDAASKVIADVASAPDIYCFMQDQLARLVQEAALAAPGKSASELISANNDAGSVAAASVSGTLYAYPMFSDSGYYLYYDTSIISEEDADSMEAIIAACEANNVKFRFALENAWYTASFFFATGCHSNWGMDTNGSFSSVDDDFNSERGLIAMKGMKKLTQSSCYDSNADIFTDAGAVVTGIWNARAAEEHFGSNLGATDLPSFEVDGISYHLGSYTGSKLMGIKPQADPKRAAVLSLLAQYLTGEECQLQRYQRLSWVPSNLDAQNSDAVLANVSVAALVKQSEYGQPQGQIHGSWWDIAKVLGADAKAATSEADLWIALDNYSATIYGLVSTSDEARQAWSVIGSICGTMWDTDFPMVEQYAGVYISESMELKAGDEFKVRQGASWDVNFGVEYNGANIVVPADGLYQVQLVWDGAQSGTVSLIPIS